MFTKSVFKSTVVWPMAAFVLSAALSGCSVTESDVGMSADDEPIRFWVADDDEGFTRGKYENAKQMTEYSIYSFVLGRAFVTNAVQTKQDDGTWVSSRTITFPNKMVLDFYAMKPGFVREDVKELTMTGTEKSFVHTLPNTNAKQTDFMFASLLKKTREESGTDLLFKFKHMFSYLRFVAKCSVEGLNVKVRSITLHNLKSKGKFTFSNDVERDGSWELYSDVDNYTFLLPEEKDLTAKNAVIHTTDSLLFVMSQKPDVFVLENDKSFADADTEGSEKAYMEIECRLWKMKDDGSGNQVPDYIGPESTKAQWVKVYYPLASTTAWTSTNVPYSGTYNVTIDFTGGYDYDGSDFLKKYTNNQMQMRSAEPIRTELATVPWEDDAANSTAFDM